MERQEDGSAAEGVGEADAQGASGAFVCRAGEAGADGVRVQEYAWLVEAASATTDVEAFARSIP